MTMRKRAALYLRVSTGEQTTDTQRQELAAVAERAGWEVIAEFVDNGVSGANGRDKRPGLDAMMKAAARREVDMIAAWSVDRLGRSLQHLVGLLGELHALGIDLYLHQQAVDTTTPAGRALFQMMGVFAELERAMIRERVMAGLERAKRNGTKSGRPIGRPKVSRKVERAILAARAEKKGVRKIAREVGCGVGTVLRVLEAEQSGPRD